MMLTRLGRRGCVLSMGLAGTVFGCDEARPSGVSPGSGIAVGDNAGGASADAPLGVAGGDRGSLTADPARIPGGVWSGEGRAIYIEAECAHGPGVGSCAGRFAGYEHGTRLQNNDSTVGNFDSGDYLMYPGVDLTGLNTLYVTYASENSGTIEVRIDSTDGELIGASVVDPSGDWSAWRGLMTRLDSVAETHDLYLVGGGTGSRGIASLDWMVLGVCTPDCEGKECGSDGCGGECGPGSCEPGYECSPEQQCVVCEPLCDGKECGDDTCGGSCGACAAGQVCAADRTCVAYSSLGGPPRLHVAGTQLQDPDNATVVLRGVSLIDIGMQHIWRDGGVPAMIDLLTGPGWKTRALRFPVYAWQGPYQFALRDRRLREQYMAEVLRPAVDYATEKGLYVIIDFHEISNVTEQKDQNARDFWAYMAGEFAGYENVIYEVFNEPVDDDYSCVQGEHDDCWPPFKEKAQAWVDIIRADAPDTLVLVGGPSWSQVIGPAADDPVDDANVAYVGHIYPMHLEGGNVEAQIRRCAAVHPVLLTEWGYDGENPEYAEIVRSMAEELGLSWTAWVADPDWGPPMLTSDGGLTHFGQFVQDWLGSAE